MVDGPAIYPTSDYPAGAFNNFVTGGIEGVGKVLDFQTKADNLRTQLVVNQSVRDAAAERQRQFALGKKPLDQGEGEYSSGDPSTAGSATGGGAPSSGGRNLGGGTASWGQYAQPIADYFKSIGYTPAAIQGAMANGLGEGGFAEPWSQSTAVGKDGQREQSFGHWQFHQGGELDGYQKWAKDNNVNDLQSSVNQARYFAYRMQQIDPNYGHITDPKAATDTVATQFEQYAGAKPGQRYGQLAAAQNYLAQAPATGAGSTQLADVPSYDPNTLARNAPPASAALGPAAPAPPAPVRPASPYAAIGAPGVQVNSNGMPISASLGAMSPQERANEAASTAALKRQGGWGGAPAVLVPPGSGAPPAASQLSIVPASAPVAPAGVVPATMAPAPSPQTYLPLVPQQQYALNPVNSDLWGQGYAAG